MHWAREENNSSDSKTLFSQLIWETPKVPWDDRYEWQFPLQLLLPWNEQKNIRKGLHGQIIWIYSNQAKTKNYDKVITGWLHKERKRINIMKINKPRGREVPQSRIQELEFKTWFLAWDPGIYRLLWSCDLKRTCHHGYLHIKTKAVRNKLKHTGNKRK